MHISFAVVVFPLLLSVFCAPLAAQTNPVPLTYQPLSPVSVSPGHPGFTLRVHGTGFRAGAVVKWNGQLLKTTAMVVESEMTRHDVVLAFETSLPDGGWPLEWAEEVAGDNMEIAAQLPVGSIIGRKIEQFFLRGSLLRAPSPEQR